MISRLYNEQMGNYLAKLAEKSKPQIYSTNRTNSAIGGEKRTNGDAIRSMTDEELAEFIASGIPKDVCKDRCGGDESFQCSDCVLDWLKQEANK